MVEGLGERGWGWKSEGGELVVPWLVICERLGIGELGWFSLGKLLVMCS